MAANAGGLVQGVQVAGEHAQGAHGQAGRLGTGVGLGDGQSGVGERARLVRVPGAVVGQGGVGAPGEQAWVGPAALLEPGAAGEQEGKRFVGPSLGKAQLAHRDLQAGISHPDVQSGELSLGGAGITAFDQDGQQGGEGEPPVVGDVGLLGEFLGQAHVGLGVQQRPEPECALGAGAERGGELDRRAACLGGGHGRLYQGHGPAGAADRGQHGCRQVKHRGGEWTAGRPIPVRAWVAR